MPTATQLNKDIAQFKATIAKPTTSESTKKILSASLKKAEEQLAKLDGGPKEVKAAEPEKRKPKLRIHTYEKYKPKKEEVSEASKVKQDIADIKKAMANPKSSEKSKAIFKKSLEKAEAKLAQLTGAKAEPVAAKVEHKTAPKKHTHHHGKVDLKHSSKAVIAKYKNSGVDIERDADRKAKPFGKRISASGHRYYEYRANRGDINPKKYPRLESGGELPENYFEIVKWKTKENWDAFSGEFGEKYDTSEEAVEEAKRLYDSNEYYAVGVDEMSVYSDERPIENFFVISKEDSEIEEDETQSEISDEQLKERLKENGISDEDFANLTEERKAQLKEQMFPVFGVDNFNIIYWVEESDYVDDNYEVPKEGKYSEWYSDLNKAKEDLRLFYDENDYYAAGIEKMGNGDEYEPAKTIFVISELFPNGHDINNSYVFEAVSDDELKDHLQNEHDFTEEEADQILSTPHEREVYAQAYLADNEIVDDDNADIEMLPEQEVEMLNNVVPAHFDSGRNIEVFGYQTKHFDVCGKAVLEFERVIAEISAEYNDSTKTAAKNSTKYAAMFADAIFGAEKEAVENNYVLKYVFDKTIDNVKMLGIHSYLSTKKMNTSWIGLHVYEIAVRIHPENIASNTDVVEQELSGGEQFARGGSIKRANMSALLQYANFDDNSHVNLLRLNENKTQSGAKYKNKNKYAVSVSTINGGQEVYEFETLEQAENKFDRLVYNKKSSANIVSESKTGNYATGGATGEEQFANGGKIKNETNVSYEDDGKTLVYGTKKSRTKISVVGLNKDDILSEMADENESLNRLKKEKIRQEDALKFFQNRPELSRQEIADAENTLERTNKQIQVLEEIVIPFYISNSNSFARGGKVLSSMSDLPENIQELVDKRKVTYRGTGMSGPAGTLIKVNGKEYLISDEDYNALGGLSKIRFSAPYRKG